jgi:ATP-binding cassette subfamily B protein
MQKNDIAKVSYWHEILSTFISLPRVLRLVWDASPSLMTSMGFIMLLQGTIPLANVIIARLLIDSALQGIIHGTIQPILLPVILELAINLVSYFCTRLHATLQILLNHRLSDHMALLILHKSSTLDLAFFENAEFYDRLTRARENVANKPLLMIMQLFTLGSSLVTVLSMLGLLFQLSWWLALIALIIPIPSFLANSRYGLKNY